jgi:hypothetical protein
MASWEIPELFKWRFPAKMGDFQPALFDDTEG